jgi:hypothetical protein
MSYPNAYEYSHSVNGVNFAVDEGAFTEDLDNDLYGGNYANPIKAGTWVSLVAAKTMTVKACEDGEKPIGYVVGKPSGGARKQYSRTVAVNLVGCYILEVEIDKTSSDIAVGDSIAFVDKGGVIGFGTFKRSEAGEPLAGVANGTRALAPCDVDGTNGGQTIPVLFGALDI